MGTGVESAIWAPEKWGRPTPTWPHDHAVNPEQSKPGLPEPLGDSPPHTYGTPIWLSAAWRAPAPPGEEGGGAAWLSAAVEAPPEAWWAGAAVTDAAAAAAAAAAWRCCAALAA